MPGSHRADLWLPTAAGDDKYVGPYRLVREAGSGGMGVVYLAVDADDRPVALKVLREHLVDDTQARARLRRELHTMRRVRDSNIAGVLDADLEAARPYIVTEFVDGPQLDHYVDDVGPLGRQGLVTLGRGLISALTAIHAVGVVHRDLKPGNVLLEGHRPVVIDFGIAQLADDVRLTITGLFVGTPGYVAPETIYGDPATPATDWWAWAAVLAFAATGGSPAGKGPIEVVLDRIRRGELRLDRVDPALQPLLHDCLAVRPADRPDANEIRHRFERYCAGHSTGPSRVTSPAPPGVAASREASDPRTAVLPVPAAGDGRVYSGAVSDGHGDQPPNTPPASRAQPLREPRPAPPLRRPDEQPPPAARTRTARAREVGARRASSTMGPILACAGLVTAAAMSMPLAGGILLLLLLTTARVIDGFVSGLRWREEISGSRGRAVALQVITSPWSALTAGLRTALTMILPTVCAAGGTYLASQLLPTYAGASQYQANLAVGIGTVVGLLMLWFGPGGMANRRASHAAVRALTPTGGATLALTTALSVAVGAILIVIWRYPVLDWWPLSRPPTRGL